MSLFFELLTAKLLHVPLRASGVHSVNRNVFVDTDNMMVTKVTVAEATDIFAVAMLVLHVLPLSYLNWERTLNDRYDTRFDRTVDAYMCADTLWHKLFVNKKPCSTREQIQHILDTSGAMSILQDTLQRNIGCTDISPVLGLLVDWFVFVRSTHVHPKLM